MACLTRDGSPLRGGGGPAHDRAVMHRGEWRGRRGVCALLGALLFGMGACGGDDDGQDDGGSDDGTTSDASLPDAGADAPDAGGDAPDAGGAIDSGVDGGSEGIAIEDVVTADGDTQIRQGGAAELVITGRDLGDVDTVFVGDIDGTVLAASPGEVRVDFFVPHGTAPGPRTVTVSGPGGSASQADALELTFYIVAPDVAAGGRGTYQSPATLCDLSTARPLLGDTVSLLAGEHVCDLEPGVPFVLSGGVTIEGEGSGVTVVRGGAASFPGFAIDSELVLPRGGFRGLTIEAPDPVDGALFLSGTIGLAVDDLVIEGPGVVVDVGSFADLAVTGLRQLGPGIGIDGRGEIDLTMSGSRFSDCEVGLLVRSGAADVTDTVFERCELGVRGGFIADVFNEPLVRLTRCELLDDEVGLSVGLGSTIVTDSVFRDLEVTPQASRVGARVGYGFLTVVGGEVSGMDEVGILVEGSSTTEGFARAIVGGVTIVGGPVGIEVAGFPDDELLILRDSVVREQTVASVRAVADGSGARIDLGNGGEAGGNQLSVTSGVAILDVRESPFPSDEVIDCTGITLNGRTYTGLVEGPAQSLPDYQIVNGGMLQF